MEGFCCFVRVQLVCPSLSFCRTLSRSRKSGVVVVGVLASRTARLHKSGVVVVGVLASRTARLQQSSSQGRWKEGTYLPTYHDLAKFWLSTKNEVKIV
jgi:hypothetical protein